MTTRLEASMFLGCPNCAWMELPSGRFAFLGVDHVQGLEEGRREALLIAMPQLDNARHERFARLVAAGDPACRAYIEAGYKAANDAVAWANGARLIGNDRVASRVAEIRAELEQAAQKAATVTKEWVVEKLRENVLRAMQAQPVVDREGNPTGEYRYEGNVANRALELLGKEIGMFRGDDADRDQDADAAVARALAIRDAIDRAFTRREPPTTH